MSTTTTLEAIPLFVQSDKLHTRGGIRGAWALTRRTGLPIQHMNPAGSVVVVWYDDDGSRRQKTYPRVSVDHTGLPFFLNGR